jgi:hypothetical protein
MKNPEMGLKMEWHRIMRMQGQEGKIHQGTEGPRNDSLLHADPSRIVDKSNPSRILKRGGVRAGDRRNGIDKKRHYSYWHSPSFLTKTLYPSHPSHHSHSHISTIPSFIHSSNSILPIIPKLTDK